MVLAVGWTGASKKALAPGQEGHLLLGQSFQTALPRLELGFFYEKDRHSRDLWERSPASGKGPHAKAPVGEERIGREHGCSEESTAELGR